MQPTTTEEPLPIACHPGRFDREASSLQALARLVESKWPQVRCAPELVEDVPFLDFFKGGVCIGRASASVSIHGNFFFSCCLGASTDEFYGSNVDALATLVGHYNDELPP